MKHEPIVYRIYDYISRNCKGQDNAVSAELLAVEYFTEKSPENGKRAIRQVINAIRNDNTFDNVIGSCNKGYYWATIEENSIAGNRLLSQGLKCLKAYWAMEKKSEANGQMMLPLTPHQRQAVESLCEVQN